VDIASLSNEENLDPPPLSLLQNPLVKEFILLFLMIPLLFSCAGSIPLKESGTARILSHVPFYPQETWQCGPASMAAVLNYWGLKVSPADIAAAIYSQEAKGTLDVDMVFYAAKKGWKTRQYRGGREDVIKEIDSGIPVIVLVDYGFWIYQQRHFMVVIGYDENAVIAHSGKERNKVIPWKYFLKTWEKTEFWTLRVTPP
jgi:ABC-type bacteriocin/lantibiotic exporter with double-glycine peptidase domain